MPTLKHAPAILKTEAVLPQCAQTIGSMSVRDYLPRKLLFLFCASAIIIGAIHAWADRNTMNSDGIAYLDMGEAYLRGDWQTAVNACYSPLYSWLLGLALLVLRPSPFWEFPVAHLVNFVVYLAALGCFHLFLAELIRYNQGPSTRPEAERTITLPEWAWYTLGYSLFIWSSLTLITMSVVTPDMCVAAFVYLASAIVLRMRMHPGKWHLAVLLGIVLGFGYMAKTPMFPLAIVFIGVTTASVTHVRRRFFHGLIALLVFVAVASPFVTALSFARNRLTFGDSARYNYAILINGIPHRHWQGWPADSGTPVHPTRKVFSSPDVYEYGSPIEVTYPVHYDPAYWIEGSTVHFSWMGLRAMLASSATIYSDLFFGWQSGLIVGFLILFVLGYKGWLTLWKVLQNWFLFVPVCAGMGMYAIAHVELRYIGAFVVLLWAAVASGVRLPFSEHARKLMATAICAMVVPMLFTVAVSSASKVYATARELRRGMDVTTHGQWEIAEGLTKMGVQPMDKVAVLGLGTPKFSAHWARLARVRIIAEIISYDVSEFIWAGPAIRSEVTNVFVRLGVRAVVAENLPLRVVNEGWQRIGKTNHFAYLLEPRDPGQGE